MKTTHVVTEKAEGGVFILSVLTPDGVQPKAAQIEAELQKSERAGFPWNIIAPAALPADRTFRAAWVKDAGAVAVDMAKAVEIHKDTLRKLREPLLKELDIEMMAAWAKGDTAAGQAVEAEKQALRDVTADPAIAAAKTPEELKAAVPDVLTASIEAETIKAV